MKNGTAGVVRCIGSGMAALVVIAGAGCYERVVGASGPGADNVSIEKANLPASKSDKVLGYKKMELKKLPGE